MFWLQRLSLVGRGKASWVTDLMVAAENHQPSAYVVCFICLIVVCIGIAVLFVEYKRELNRGSSWRSFAQLTGQGLLGLSIPALFVFWLASRLFG